MPSDPAGKIIDIGLEDELAQSYGRYAHTVILERAIPDIRDGLKPVQRRIVYAMAESRNTPENPYRKAAKTVGDVMGNYHPHGDQSIYDALVRLAQPWKLRLPLVDGHGNFGSIDDDPPAAMRYTEARLAGPAMELVTDIDKNTVDFRPNFDESSLEPTVLPARYPNLLVNGTSGLSTGFATEIPPHNLVESVEAVCLRIDQPTCTLDDVMGVLPGPDFPTGGILMGREGLRGAYETGRGKVMVRARHTVEKGDGGKVLLVVTETPYGVVKANLVRDLDALRQARSVQGILDVRDESDREGMRIVVELARSADVEGVWNFLLRKTDLQISYNFNMVAISEHRPVEAGLLVLIDAYVKHRREVVRRRAEFGLAKAKDRLHDVEGLIRAVDVLDEVIATIRASEDRADARANLVARFGFSERQAEAILELRLHRLTGLQLLVLREEQAALSAEVAELERLLASPQRVSTLIKKELREVAAKYGNPRRTEIRAEVGKLEVALEVRVKPAPVVAAVTDRGYIKRSSMQSFLASGGTLESCGARDGDFARYVIETNTTHRVLVFTATGGVFSIPVHTLPEARWSDTGVALVNIAPFEMETDRVVGVFAPTEYRADRHLLFVTEGGIVKRTPLAEFDLQRSGGVVATRLDPKDRVVAVLPAVGAQSVVLATAAGQVVRFRVSDVSEQGRSAKGVRGMGLNHGDRVVAAALAPVDDLPGHDVVIFTTAGKAKRTPLDGFPVQRRGGKGMLGIIQRAKKPHVILAIATARSPRDVFLVYPSDGAPRRLEAGTIQTTRRDGNGFQLQGLAESSALLAVFALGAPAEVGPAGEGLATGDVDTEGTVDTTGAGEAEPVAEVVQMPLLPAVEE